MDPVNNRSIYSQMHQRNGTNSLRFRNATPLNLNSNRVVEIGRQQRSEEAFELVEVAAKSLNNNSITFSFPQQQAIQRPQKEIQSRIDYKPVYLNEIPTVKLEDIQNIPSYFNCTNDTCKRVAGYIKDQFLEQHWFWSHHICVILTDSGYFIFSSEEDATRWLSKQDSSSVIFIRHTTLPFTQFEGVLEEIAGRLKTKISNVTSENSRYIHYIVPWKTIPKE